MTYLNGFFTIIILSIYSIENKTVIIHSIISNKFEKEILKKIKKIELDENLPKIFSYCYNFFQKTNKVVNFENFFPGAFTFHWHNRWTVNVHKKSPLMQLFKIISSNYKNS